MAARRHAGSARGTTPPSHHPSPLHDPSRHPRLILAAGLALGGLAVGLGFARGRVAELVRAGVVLSSGQEYAPERRATFLPTGLNDVKGPMIADATARAREAAEQFANGAGTTLGGIRRANQGVFEILPRDQAPGITQESRLVKTVRVVSTVDYLLND